MNITLESWLKTHSIGGRIGVGTPASVVLSILGETEYTGPEGHNPTPGYWLYGEVEFGFGEDKKVNWFQVDTFRVGATDPPAISIDWQGLSPKASVEACTAWLTEHGLTFRVQKDHNGFTIIVGESELLLSGTPASLITICTPSRAQIRALRT